MHTTHLVKLVAGLPLLAVLAIVGCSRNADTPSPTSTAKSGASITLSPSNGPDQPGAPIFDDDRYSFRCQDYGHGTLKTHDSTFIPGVFVYSKSLRRWMRIERISTTGAKFGYTSLTNNVTVRSIFWDFRGLATQPSVSIPLKVQEGIVDLPNAVDYLPANNVYRLHFDSQPTASDSETILTTLLIPRPNLDAAFQSESPKPTTFPE